MEKSAEFDFVYIRFVNAVGENALFRFIIPLQIYISIDTKC